MIVKVGLEEQVGVCQVEKGDWKDTAGAQGCGEAGRSRGLVQGIRWPDPCPLLITVLLLCYPLQQNIFRSDISVPVEASVF